MLVICGSEGLCAGIVPVLRHIRKDFKDLSSPLLEGEREVNFSYFLRLLLVVTEVAVLQQPGAKQNPTAQGLVTARASRTKDKPKICVGTDVPVYSPAFLFQTPQEGFGHHGSRMREGGFALGSDPKACEVCQSALSPSCSSSSNRSLAQLCWRTSRAKQPPILPCAKLFLSL